MSFILTNSQWSDECIYFTMMHLIFCVCVHEQLSENDSICNLGMVFGRKLYLVGTFERSKLKIHEEWIQLKYLLHYYLLLPSNKINYFNSNNII